MISNTSILPVNIRSALRYVTVREISKLTVKPETEKAQCDYIGPVDQTSNLRQHVRHIPKNETETQKRLRELRIQIDASNQQFWTQHNESFYKERQHFIREQKCVGDEEVTADKMSEFYKKFLDENHKRHVTYNKVWYQNNFKMLLLAFQVELEKLFKKVF